MTNAERYSVGKKRDEAFNAHCMRNGRVNSQDCTGCHYYGVALGMNSCFHDWLNRQSKGDEGLRPWSFDELRSLVGRTIDFTSPNRCRVAYLVLGAYKAQNGIVSALLAGDAVSTVNLCKDEKYSINGNRCGVLI